MHNSKLVFLFQTFNNSTLKDLKKWVRSPFHNEQKPVIALFDYLYEMAPNFIEKYLKKEIVWQLIHKGERYDGNRMRRLMADLLKVCEEYISWQKLEEDRYTKKTYQLQYYQEKNLPKHFATCLRSLQSYQAKNPRQSSWYPYHQYRLEREIGQSIAKQRDRNVEPNLQVLSNHLDAFYLIHKLKTCCYMMNYKNFHLTEYELPLLSEILAHCAKTDYNELPMIGFYYHTLNAFIEPTNPTHFEALKNNLLNNLNIYTKEEALEMFVAARNYCIQQVNKGNSDYLHQLFSLYEIEIEHQILLDANNTISPFTYKNIVTLGMKLQKYDWTQAFIESHKEYLTNEFQASSYAFNLARLYFQQGKFEEIISLLNQMEHREIFIELAAKTLLLKTYYELKEFEVLHSFLDSFQMFIRRKKKVLRYHGTSYLNLIKMMRQLIRLNYYKGKNKEVLQAKILETKELAAKNWVLEKLKEI